MPEAKTTLKRQVLGFASAQNDRTIYPTRFVQTLKIGVKIFQDFLNLSWTAAIRRATFTSQSIPPTGCVFTQALSKNSPIFQDIYMFEILDKKYLRDLLMKFYCMQVLFMQRKNTESLWSFQMLDLQVYWKKMSSVCKINIFFILHNIFIF